VPKFYFPKGVPLQLKIWFAVMIGNGVMWTAAALWAEEFAPRQPTGNCLSAMHWRFGSVTFVPLYIARYIFWGLWLNGALVGGFVLMLFWYEKRGRAIKSDSWRIPK
jgi:hypothetical protein